MLCERKSDRFHVAEQMLYLLAVVANGFDEVWIADGADVSRIEMWCDLYKLPACLRLVVNLSAGENGKILCASIAP